MTARHYPGQWSMCEKLSLTLSLRIGNADLSVAKAVLVGVPDPEGPDWWLA
jgi:hypothetical protein